MSIFGTLGNIGGKITEGAKTVGSKVASGLEAFKNKLGDTTTNMPSQYQFDKLGGTTGTTPSQYQFDNLGGTLYDDYDLGGVNAGKNTFSTGTESSKWNFARALLQQPNTSKDSGDTVIASPQYSVTPSMVDYSQYMGLSPETQRYLYGGR